MRYAVCHSLPEPILTSQLVFLWFFRNEETRELETEEPKQLEAEEPKQFEGSPSGLYDGEEVQQLEEGNRTPELTQDETAVVRQLPEEYEESMPMAMSMHPGDAAQQDMAMAVEMEVVEAAPVAEVLSQYEGKFETNDELVDDKSQPRPQRARTAGDATYCAD